MRRLATLASATMVLLAGVPAIGTAEAGEYHVITCASSGDLTGPVPSNLSRGRFSAATDCRRNAGGQTGYVMRPTNQGPGQTASRSEFAALQWSVPDGVFMRRAYGELGGTSINGSGSGFGGAEQNWMFRSFGLRGPTPDLFAARFSVPNHAGFFLPGDAPGNYGFYWGNNSGGLGTPAQWGVGQPYDFSRVSGVLGRTMFPTWAALPVGGGTTVPGRPGSVPEGPYDGFRIELRCSEAICRSAGFTEVQFQNLGFWMSDPAAPDTLAAAPGADDPVAGRIAAGEWLGKGVVNIDWSGHDAGTGISGARLVIDGKPAGTPGHVRCPGGGPGETRSAFKPCPAAARGELELDLARAPQGSHRLGVCVEDGVEAATCRQDFNLRVDSVAPAIDAQSMKLITLPDGGQVLSLVNPDAEPIAAGAVSPLSRLSWSVEERTEAGYKAVRPERTIDLSSGGAAEVRTPELALAPGRTYRICARLVDQAGNIARALACTVVIADSAPQPPPEPIVVRVPSRKYCALTGFSIRPDRRGLKATLSARRYSRFVRIQLFPNTRAVRRVLASGHYRRLRQGSRLGPILNLKRKVIRNRTTGFRFPRINLRTYPALYRHKGRSLIVVPRVSNEYNRCTVGYRQRLDRRVGGLRTWKDIWGISDKYRLLNRRHS